MTFLATNWWFFMIHFVIKSRYLLWTRDASDIVLSGHIADCVVFSVWCYFRFFSSHTKTVWLAAVCVTYTFIKKCSFDSDCAKNWDSRIWMPPSLKRDRDIRSFKWCVYNVHGFYESMEQIQSNEWMNICMQFYWD